MDTHREKKSTAYTLADVIAAIEAMILDIEGVYEGPIDAACPLSTASPCSVAFCTRSDQVAVDNVASCAAAVVLVPATFPANGGRPGQCLLRVPNPRLAFISVVGQLFAAERTSGIHQSASVDEEAEIDGTAFIGPLCYVGKSKIGRNSTLAGNVFVYDGVEIGADVTIHAGAVIGADGFGYERDDAGVMVKFPHLGGVTIEDRVEIGANACIDRGTLSNTRILEGSKIDNLVHIAHNTQIGPDAVVIAHAMVGGSTRVGPRAWVAPSACLRDNIDIGADATVGLASCVTKNVKEGDTVLGSPARPIAEYKAMLAALREVAAPK